jgi:glycine cleavage system H protein
LQDGSRLVEVEGFKFPKNLQYSKDHLWIKLQNGGARIGFTSLGEALCKEIVHIDLPFVGETVKQGQEMGSFETIKAVIRLYAPVSGKIKKVNQSLYEKPDKINADPYGQGWLLVIEPKKRTKELGLLMDAEEAAKYYQTVIEEERVKFGDYEEELE